MKGAMGKMLAMAKTKAKGVKPKATKPAYKKVKKGGK